MKIVTIDKAGCNLLFLLMKENSIQRENTLRHLGYPVFDTATGNVHYVEFPRPPLDDQEIHQTIEEMAKDQIQMLLDLKLIPSSLAKRWGLRSRFPTRYVEIPVPNPEAAFRWHDYSQDDREEVSATVIDWLEKLGHERGIHFQYQIGDLSY